MCFLWRKLAIYQARKKEAGQNGPAIQEQEPLSHIFLSSSSGL
jgi:hypothetical protein